MTEYKCTVVFDYCGDVDELKQGFELMLNEFAEQIHGSVIVDNYLIRDD